jgi:hypothetical protein
MALSRWSNAGHIAPWRVGRETVVEASLPLGIAPDLALEESTLQLGWANS